jgi:arsenate reductase
MPPKIYVNPSCSKCRTALSLLEEHGVRADTTLYLDDPPTVSNLRELMALLAIDDPRLMMRTGEPLYGELALDDVAGDALLEAVAQHPILLERPIFAVAGRAVIARPPERVLELL